MLDQAAPLAAESEREEVEAIARALGETSRMARLLRFLAEHHFRGERGELTEFKIATEVLGRSKSTFDSGTDAIARVEAHRLRKRLNDFYSGPGKDHPIQISIPTGSYAPVFVRRAVQPEPSTDVQMLPGTGISDQSGMREGDFPVEATRRSPALMFSLVAMVAVLAAVAGFLAIRPRRSVVPAAALTPSGFRAAETPLPGAPPPARIPLRILAGYSGSLQTDSAGNVWGPDEYMSGGGPWLRPAAPLIGTSEPMIFGQWRIGDFSYKIPVPPGVYELHLFFVTTDRASDNWSTFGVSINGASVLSGFDINSDALGEDIADERVFRDVTPGPDGMIRIRFSSQHGAPQLNALELLSGLPHKQLPIRLLMQQSSLTDRNGHFWRGDNYFTSGRLSDQRQQVTGGQDPNLFTSERFGHFRYTLPVDPRDRYTLVLHFAEFYFGSGMPGGGGEGSRIFRVLCNGETLLDNFDIYKEAGSLHVLTKTFSHIKPSAQGKINLTFEPVVNNATVSGIEVLDESQ